jgi:O-antigen/teichoic acid export membrane protein
MLRGRSFFDPRHWRFALTVSLPMILQAVYALLPPQANRLMLTLHGQDQAAGIYSLAYTFGAVLEDILLSFNLSWVPSYFERLRAGDHDRIDRQAAGYQSTIALLTVGFLLVSPEIFRLLMAPAYWPGTPLLALIALAAYLRFLTTFPLNYALYAKRTGWTVPASIAALAVNIGGDALLIPRWGAVGAACATVLAYLVMLAVLWVCAGSRFRLPHRARAGWRAAAVVACVALALATQDLWWVRWPLAMVCAALLLRHVIARRGFF